MGGVALAQMQKRFSEWGPRGLSCWCSCRWRSTRLIFIAAAPWDTKVQKTPDSSLASLCCHLFALCSSFNSSPVLFFSALRPPKSILTFMERKLGAGKSTAVLSIPENHWLLMQIGPQLIEEDLITITTVPCSLFLRVSFQVTKVCKIEVTCIGSLLKTCIV